MSLRGQIDIRVQVSASIPSRDGGRQFEDATGNDPAMCRSRRAGSWGDVILLLMGMRTSADGRIGGASDAIQEATMFGLR